MALADTARLIASLDLKGNFNAQIRASEKALGGFESRLDRTQTRAYRAGAQIGRGIKTGAVIAAGAIGFLALNVQKGLQSLTELETVTTQTNAVLKSTKGVAGQTAESIRNLAEKYEGLNAIIDDKVIQSAENVLLTFTAVRKQAFEPAIRAALDMSTALGTDLQGSVIQIGKALQDPIKGITALRRVGVNFSADQVKVIKRLVETGQTLKAQKLILAELNTEFGGSFIAQGNTTAGKVAKFKDAIEDLQKALANALLPTIGKVADGLTKFLADPQVVKGISDLGVKIASLFSDKNLAAGGRFLQDAFKTAKEAAPIVEGAARATFGLVQGAVSLFKSLPEPLQKLAVGAFAVNKLTGGLVTNISGGIKDALGGFIKDRLGKGGSPANPLFVADVTGGLGKAGGILPAGGAGLGSKVLGLASKVFIVGLAAEAASLLSGPVVELGKNIHTSLLGENNPLSDFGKAWTNWQQNADWPFGQKNAPEWAGGKPANTTPSTGGPLGASLKSISEAISGLNGSGPLAGIDAMTNKLLAGLNKVTTGFSFAIGQLKENRDPKAIENAIKTGLGLISKGRGNISDTKGLIAGFKTALKNTHDPKLRAALQAAIHKVEARLPAREFAARQLAKADALIRDGKVTNRDLKDLKSIERALKDRGLPHAASVIKQRIATAQHAQVEASRWAGSQAASAIRAKKWQFTTNVTVNTEVSIKNQIRREHQLARVTASAS